VIAAPVGSTQFAGPPAGSSKFTFDPETFGKSAPYRVAMLGGPNNERATIVQTLLGRASIATTERSHPDALFSGRLAQHIEV
jgi:hypothetical protein